MTNQTETERYEGWLDRKLREIDAHNADPPVLMCSCANWDTCEHPWPLRYFLPKPRFIGRIVAE